MLEFWNSGIMGSGLRLIEPPLRPVSPRAGSGLGEDNGMVGLENQNEYNCIDFLIIVAYFLGCKQKMDV
jgi:hypothetical protein